MSKLRVVFPFVLVLAITPAAIAKPAPGPQSAAPGMTSVEMDGLTFRLLSGEPKRIERDGKYLAVIQGENLIFLPYANLDDAAKANLQAEFEKFTATHGQGAPATNSAPATEISKSATADKADPVKWVSGEPTVHLADGWTVEFAGGNGSKIRAVSPAGYVVEMHYSAGAHDIGSALKGAAKSIGTMGTDASFEGGAWAGQVEGKRSFNQDPGLMGVKSHMPILAVQAAGEILKAQQIVMTSGVGHQYSFTGTEKMSRLAKGQ